MAHLRRWIALLTVASAALGVLAALAPAQYPGALIPYMIDVGAGWASPQGSFGHRATTGYDVAFAFGIQPGGTIDDPAWGCVNVIPSATATRFTDTDNAVGWNAGGGIALGIYPVDLFIEARYHDIGTAAYRTHILPVTLGLRL